MIRSNGILLSAGLGTRLRPYTDLAPKPVIPFLTIPLAVYPLSLFDKIEIGHLIVNVHHLPDQVIQLFQRLHWPCHEIIFSDEKEKILGSGGGIRHAIKKLKGHGSFFVANADEVILPHHYQVIKDAFDFHSFHKGIATLLVVQHPDVGTKFGGAWVKAGTKITQFSKTPIINHKGYHFVGVMILSDRIENYFFDDDTREENVLYDTLTKAMAQGEEVHIHEIEAKWFETGNPTDFIKATEACLTALQNKNQEPWVEYLRQLIRINEKSLPILEKEYPELLEKLNKTISELKGLPK